MKTIYRMALVAMLSLFLSPIWSQDNSNKLYTEFELELKGDYRYFFDEGLYPSQQDHFISFAVQPELFMEWDDGAQLLQFTAFGRWEQHDTRRTHADIRELYWQTIQGNWELSIGLKKIFWGITESVHLVDIVNQTDVVESFDGEQKLGQPMVHFSYLSKFGTFDIIAMPYFRKREFAGVDARFRFPVVFDRDDLSFENEDLEEWYPSFAFRWGHSAGAFDFGISQFHGIGREPLFKPSSDGISLDLFYPIIDQTGIELQVITGPAIWKLESIVRFSDVQDMFALAAGLEYTFGNINNSGLDIGLIGEYLYDDRDELSFTGFDNDVFLGCRLAFNDTQSSELLFGGIFDLEKSTSFYSLEGSRRFGDSWKVTLEARILSNVSERELLQFFRNDSFAQLAISKFF